MTDDPLAVLRGAVVADRELALRLRRVVPERFAAELLAVAAERGITLAPDAIEAAIRAGAITWGLRWTR